jgi:hypothetical protein
MTPLSSSAVRCVVVGAMAALALAGAVTGAVAQASDAAGGEPPPSPSATPAPAKPAPPPAAEARPAPRPAAAAKPESALPQNLEQLDPGAAVALLGKKVRDAAGKDMGLVVDVLVDRDGLVRAAVIDFGGFLGVGSRKIAIDRRLLQFEPDDRDTPILLSLDRADVRAAPEYKPSAQPMLIVGPSPAEGRSTLPREK